MIPWKFNNSATCCVCYFIIMWCFIDQSEPTVTTLPSGQDARLKNWPPLFEWCLFNNCATVLPIISRTTWVGECLRKCEPWIFIVFCTLSSNLFVCTQRWQSADPSHIRYQCGVTKRVWALQQRGHKRVYHLCEDKRGGGGVHTDLEWTCTWNQDTDRHTHTYIQTCNAFFPNIGVAWHLIVWRLVNLNHNVPCSLAEGVYWKMDFRCSCLFRGDRCAARMCHITAIYDMVKPLSCFCL